MPKKKSSARADAKKKKPIKSYTHKGKKRANNPPVGLVTPETDPDDGKKTYAYDPHLDPQLTWAGKKEHTSCQVPTVSLHVHERIDPLTIIEAVKRRNGAQDQLSLFESREENPPLREAIDFYKHPHGWSNRLIAGDSLLVMNSLLEKEGMAGQVQMVYLDPPYGIRYGSNFQPFVNKREVKDGKDEDLTQEPETIKAFRDTWELGIHSYLAYLRDRLLLSRDLLSESGSIFVQISDENVHLIRDVLDEVFGAASFVSQVVVQKTGGLGAAGLKSVADYLLWYAKKKNGMKYRQLFRDKVVGVGEGTGIRYDQIESPNGKLRRAMSAEERQDPSLIPSGWRPYQLDNLTSDNFRDNTTVPFTFRGETFHPGPNAHWKTTVDGLESLAKVNRIEKAGKTIRFVRYLQDFPAFEITNLWDDVAGAPDKIYVVQTSASVIQRCILMSTDPGDLVFDPTCGSGTTAVVAERWGRRWISCDTSRVSTALARQRMLGSTFEFFEFARPDEGVSSGFLYKTVPHVTLGSIARNESPEQETLVDQPRVDSTRHRVTGPFTVEAVPAPTVRSLSVLDETPSSDESIARSGETLRLNEWRDELLKTGVRARGGERIEFSRIEPLAGTRWLHADGETKEPKPRRVVISFGPEHAPLEQRQVALAIEEAQNLAPKPTLVLFCSFHFDPEAAKD